MTLCKIHLTPTHLFARCHEISCFFFWMASLNVTLDPYPTKANDLQSMTSECRLNHFIWKKVKKFGHILHDNDEIL